MPLAAIMMRPSFSWTPKRRDRLKLAIGLGIFIGAFASESNAEQANGASAKAVDFHIPAQPLAQALIAYGTATGFELYYNAALAEGRRSRAVTRTLSPVAALRLLLDGTGLIPQITGPASFILIQAPREAVHQAESVPQSSPYEAYFADIQARIGEALCKNATAGQQERETFLRVWLSSSGVISRADIFGADENSAGQHDLVNAVQGLAVAPPPSNMPQPVTLVVFPAASVWKNCGSADGAQEAK